MVIDLSGLTDALPLKTAQYRSNGASTIARPSRALLDPAGPRSVISSRIDALFAAAPRRNVAGKRRRPAPCRRDRSGIQVSLSMSATRSHRCSVARDGSVTKIDHGRLPPH